MDCATDDAGAQRSLHMDNLPNEILALIFCQLPCLDRTLCASPVCRRWRNAVSGLSGTGRVSCLVAGDLWRSRRSAAKSGHTGCVARMCTKSALSGGWFDRSVYESAVERDDLATLIALRVIECDHRDNRSSLAVRDVIAFAARCGSANCLVYAITQYNKTFMDILWVPWTCQHADPTKHAMCLDIITDLGHSARDVAIHAAARGHADCLRVGLRTRDFDVIQVIDACGGDRLCLDVLYQVEGVKLTYVAASRGRVDILRLLRSCGVEWDGHTCKVAAKNGHLDCLRYAREDGCPWDATTCAEAVANKNLDCLRYALANGCPCDEHALGDAIALNRVAYLRCIHEAGRPWDKSVCEKAAACGSLECLRYAHENGCPWDEETCTKAAEHDNIDCLVYAHENGCPWDERALVAAVRADSIECLRYMHDQNMEWDRKTYRLAYCCDRGNKCFKYVSNYKDCPIERGDPYETDSDTDTDAESETQTDSPSPQEDAEACDDREPEQKRARTASSVRPL
ncbi:Ankyrin repeat domain containing protein [Pandoravirus macleodensis]|uniref:Ankyrin repeat domain containing protein n=1 Tax=Pandoravirus macleodensis TaxID=2107707 RepID=A0A2U7UFL4_9VIRU|nr:Ankyrin repeat domain containing protein [Pandoravirus macleodensis]AVK77165.1 Ankyrin repeat domain containing protein [Pandoravirus macleodensis]